MRKRAAELLEVSEHAISTQHAVLIDLLKHGALTEFGQEYHFDTLQSFEDYAARVPLHTYDDLQPMIERMRKGERNVLWPGRVKWFAKSSGTTSGVSKFIPISNENLELCHFEGGKSELALYCNINPETAMFEGLGLRLGGATKPHEDGQSNYGDLSAILIQNMPYWAELVSAPSHEVALMDQWEEKIEALADEAIASNITSFWGVSSWFLVLFQRVLEKTGKSNLLEVWPNLELFAHGGVNFSPYKAQFQAMMPGDQVTYLENYNASEGFFAVQDDPKSEGMLLLVNNGIYYEFIPMTEFNGTASKTLPLEHVKVGVDYAMVITTNSGLWRYLIGDTVKFTSIQPYRIVVSGRTAHFINAFGEELIIADAENALRQACETTFATIRDFHAAPKYIEGKKSGSHQWLIEFNREPNDLAAFAATLDRALKAENSDYEAKRTADLILGPPEIMVAKPGVFHRWLKERDKLGGQHKVPRLSNNRTLIEQFLAIHDRLSKLA